MAALASKDPLGPEMQTGFHEETVVRAVSSLLPIPLLMIILLNKEKQMSLTFYKCPVCGEMVLLVKKAKCTPSCCGKEMTELKAGAVDAAVEKHVPACTVADGKLSVKVGSAEHPMAEEHYIEFIAVETEDGFTLRYLKPGDKPEAEFAASGAVAVYAYCNLHGLWKADL